MRRELNGMELNSCKPTRKPLVSAINSKKQFQFAKQHKDWTVEQRGNVMWSGGVKIQPIPERWVHQGHPMNGFFFPRWNWHVSGRQCQDPPTRTGHHKAWVLTQSKIFGKYWNTGFGVVRFFRRQFSALVTNYCKPGRQ
ncbi:hypothetical protein AVEN_1617-1 [Araneus ventricosus]|uniref:Transposase Tc1-like domain-containing protein n=1 Tax=Araneus ventricosus TaxID=182803 RepID=A0A4Y2KFR8_ARAVE|nr:hypothetical protein AVEN_1617-1 [Araneus ventricosus]